MEIFKDEQLYNVDCRLGYNCIHFTSAHPINAYMGCDGIPKYRTEPVVKCFHGGKKCTQLTAAEQKFEKYSKCDEVEGIPYIKNQINWPQPTCFNATRFNSPLQDMKACVPTEESFWKDLNSLTTNFKKSSTCVRYSSSRQTSLIIPKFKKSATNQQLCKTESCKNWGPWFEWSDCSWQGGWSSNGKYQKTRLRFCKVR